ncbi:MAG: HYR domain-containing protein, partial [Actinomyces sp.]
MEVSLAETRGLFDLRAVPGGTRSKVRVHWNGERAVENARAETTVPVEVLPRNLLCVRVKGKEDAVALVKLEGFVVDASPPSLDWLAPPEGGLVEAATELRLVFSDALSGIRAGSLAIELNSTDVTQAFARSEGGATARISDLPPALFRADNTLRATVLDAACNGAEAVLRFRGPDVTPPVLERPADLVVEQEGPGGTSVRYEPPTATDDVDPAPTVVCSPAPGSLFPPGETTVTCTATDRAGNRSQVAFTVRVRDTIAPTVTLTPADTAVVVARPGVPTTIPLAASYVDAASGVDPASFRARLDNNDVSSSFTVGPAGATATSPELSVGAHTFAVTIADAAGNAVTASVGFLVDPPPDETPPTVGFDAPSAGSCVGPGSEVRVTFRDAESGIGPGTFAVKRGSTDLTSSFSIQANTAVATLGGLGLSDGQVTLSASVQDQAGNQGSGSVAFEYDSTPPSLGLEPADGSTVLRGTEVTLVASYADTGCGVDLASLSATLDGNPQPLRLGAGSANATLGGLEAGAHTFSVTLSDLGGNEVTKSTTFLVVSEAGGFELTISPGDPTALEATGANDLTIRAIEPGGATATGFAGFVQLTTSDGLLPLDGLIVDFPPAAQGVVTLRGQAVFQTLGTVVVTARSLEPSLDVSGTLAVNVVLPAPIVFPEPPAQIGEDGALTVTGLSFQNQVVELLVDGAPVAQTTAGPSGQVAFGVQLAAGEHQLALRSGGKTSAAVTVRVPAATTTGLVASPSPLRLAVGETRRLTVARSLSTGPSEEVTDRATYETSGPAVATVSAAGVVQGKSPGNATVSASFDGFVAEVGVRVTAPILASTSPIQGEVGVAVTRETILRFSAPLDPTTVTDRAIFAGF